TIADSVEVVILDADERVGHPIHAAVAQPNVLPVAVAAVGVALLQVGRRAGRANNGDVVDAGGGGAGVHVSSHGELGAETLSQAIASAHCARVGVGVGVAVAQVRGRAADLREVATHLGGVAAAVEVVLLG